MRRRTHIFCSIGPASREPAVLERMVEAGMDWARLNFSHGTAQEHRLVAAAIREIATRVGRPVNVLADLEGPKLRIGALPAPLDLHIGQEVALFAGFSQEPGVVPIPDAPAFKALHTGDRVFLDDGAVELEVQECVDPLRFRATVTVGGRADSRSGLTVRGKEVDLPVLSGKDVEDLAVAREIGAHAVAQSMVRRREDVDELRAALGRDDPAIPIIAKIESASALSDLERIAVGSAGLVVARGDLGVNIPRAQVPIRQKEILALCQRCGSMGIVATQMLLSMVDNRRPTRAEVSDVANAVLDGASGLMLSEETSIGHFPVDAVREVAKIAETIEASRWFRRPG